MIHPVFSAPTWPQGPNRLLLRAALHPDPGTAQSAWKQWRDSVDLRLPGITARTLSPTHHLFHACIHGVPFCPVPSFRWIADAMLILRNSPTPIDWSEFLRCTTDFRVSVLATHALTYLREEFDAPIPTTVLDPLTNQSPEPWEFAEFHHITHHPPSLHPVWLWHRHQRQFALRPDPDATHRISSYLDFVRIRWDLPNRWHLPASFLQRTISYFFGTAS